MLIVHCTGRVVTHDLVFQTMGGDFSGKGQQDCTKGIYALSGKLTINDFCVSVVALI